MIKKTCESNQQVKHQDQRETVIQIKLIWFKSCMIQFINT